MKEYIYKKLPHCLQNILITVFNILSYQVRYGGKYEDYKNTFDANKNLNLQELKDIQKNKYKDFIKQVHQFSNFYKTLWADSKNIEDIAAIEQLPIVNKENIRTSIKAIYTINEDDAVVSKTGGTTGKSLEVRFTKEDIQERFAMLDNFRSTFGYKLGEKTAWFSGKDILNNRDIKKNRFWKTDWLYKIRYYSTFYVKWSNLKFYIADLIDYQPEFIVGFPSNLYEIAKYGIKNNIEYPNGIKAIFPTAETITKESREAIETFFKAPMYDQYASSEGAPFIFECVQRKLHLELQSGVFEVLDYNDKPVKSGRLVVTSFTTKGTPLVRYDIGDSIVLSDKVCSCGNNNPLVEKILGRSDDFIYSQERGKINLGNISNTLKGVKGIKKFQVIQDSLDELIVLIEIDEADYLDKDRLKFLKNWKDRIGLNMKISLKVVDGIQVERSGKFRMVKNNIKHLIDD